MVPGQGDSSGAHVDRVQLGVRMERSMVKVLKALAEFEGLSLGQLLEKIVLHSFEPVPGQEGEASASPHSRKALEAVADFSRIYEMHLGHGRHLRDPDPEECAPGRRVARRCGTRLPRMDPDVAADEEALARIRGICRSFDGADEGRLQDRPLFRVGRRRFAIFNGASSPPRPRWSAFGRSLHFLTDPQERDALAQDGRFVASPHHGDRGWMAVSLDQDGAADWNEVRELLDAAYRQVAPGQRTTP